MEKLPFSNNFKALGDRCFRDQISSQLNTKKQFEYISYITNNFPQMCLMPDQFHWGYS